MSALWQEQLAAAERAAARGSLHGAAELLEQARVAAETAGAPARERIPLLHALASVAQALGRPDTADRWFTELLEASRAALAKEDPELTAAAIALALNRAVASGAVAAAAFVETFLEEQRAALGENHAQVSRAAARLGELMSRAGHHDAGRAQVAAALATAAPEDAAFCQWLLGIIDARRGALPEAEQALRAALASADAEVQVSARLELGDLLSANGDVPGAAELMKGAVKAAPSASRGREARGRLAALYLRSGKAAEALPLLKENTFQLEDELGPASLPLGLAVLELGSATALADPATAPPHELFFRARQVLEVATGPSSLPVAHALLLHASLYLRPQADHEAGAALVHRALEIIVTAFGQEHAAVAEPLTYLAAFRWLAKDAERAAVLSQRALALLANASDDVLARHASVMEKLEALDLARPSKK